MTNIRNFNPCKLHPSLL